MIWGNRQVNTVYFSLKLLTFQLSNVRAFAPLCFIADDILAQINHNAILRMPEMMPYPT